MTDTTISDAIVAPLGEPFTTYKPTYNHAQNGAYTTRHGRTRQPQGIQEQPRHDVAGTTPRGCRMSDWIERFWDKVDIGAPDDCWEWQAATNPQGYGAWRKRRDGTHRNAHRFAFEIAEGYQPEEKFVLHTCDNRLCVNPNHIYAGSQSENIKDAFERGDATQLGEENSCAKLTEEDVREIKWKLQNTDLKQVDIADDYPVNPGVISNIKLGKRWSHVEVDE